MDAHILGEDGDWRQFTRFITDLPGADLVIGLSALWREWGDCDVGPAHVCPGKIPWDSRNAEAMIRADLAAGVVPYAYELGNEPGVWNWTWGIPIVSPEQVYMLHVNP